MDVREATYLIDHRVRDYRPKLPRLQLRFLRKPAYLDAARDHPAFAEEITLGLLDDLETDLRHPIFATLTDHLLTACPEMVVQLLADEPRSLHHPYVDGAVLRELLLFFADEGDAWQGRVQVREVMARHFPLQLIAAESVEGSGITLSP